MIKERPVCHKILDIASGNSFWRGIDYYNDGMVIECNVINDNEVEGKVKGSGDKVYDVKLDLEHPKRSTCTCPHADGTRRVCKHKVALFFTAFPEEFQKALDREKEAEEEYEEEMDARWQEHCEEVREYVNGLEIEDLRQELYDRIIQDDSNDDYWGW